MATLRIEGGRRLSGTVAVEGNKNSALPLIAACLLSEEECVISNVPRIRDVEVLLEIIRGLGATVQGAGTSTLRIKCESITTERPDPVLVGKLRGSVLLLGPLLARRGAARLAPPGGDFPARRTISTHIQALMALGAVPVDEPGHALDAPEGLTGASFYLDEASVTGTETALLAAASARGRTEIRHAAMEPHVVELCLFLRAMGVSVEGIGTPTIRVEGAARCKGATHRLQGDYVEAGSWGVVAAITGGEITVNGARAEDMEVIAAPLRQMGLACQYRRRALLGLALDADRHPPNHDWPLAGVPQRHGEPRDRPRHPGRRPHAGARLALRAAPLRAGAAERDASRPVSVRSAPHHRQRAEEAQRTAARRA